MKCSSCGFKNPENKKNCLQCQIQIKKSCANCATLWPLDHKFCAECGVLLLPSKLKGGEERRRITIVFVDLVNSTRLSEKLDSEAYLALLTTYQNTCRRVVHRYEGEVAQLLGDGVLIYFGYPIAHEDDAQRAVRTALEIQEELSRINHRLVEKGKWLLESRIGIHTGEAVIRERLAIGASPNIAFHVQKKALPNTIYVSDVTYRLVEDFFDGESKGNINDKAESREVFQVLGFGGKKNKKTTPLVGREAELGMLEAKWKHAIEGKGQVVALSGEAGMGKSRLVQVFKTYLDKEVYIWLECCGSPYHKGSVFYPLIDLLHQIIDLHPEDSDQDKLRKVEKVLQQTIGRSSNFKHISLDEAVPLLAKLLSISLEKDNYYRPIDLSPQRQKKRTLELIIALLLGLSREKPLLFVLEDLHWVDPSTHEFLDMLIDQGATMSMLALFTFRPKDFVPLWIRRTFVTSLSLGPLSERQIGAMVKNIAQGKTIPQEILNKVISRTVGNPLFVEEFIKMVLEADWNKLGIPETLQDLLMARLDQLSSTVKKVVQIAAIIGRQFSYGLLLNVCNLDEPSLRRDLKSLVEVELLYQQGLPPQSTYFFKHILIQETAYNSLTQEKRQEYHRKIAHILLTRTLSDVDDLQPEVFARHYTEADLKDKAVEYWQLAGKQALDRYANIEAVAHFRKGVELIEQLPQTPKWILQKLKLLVKSGVSLFMVKGYASEEVEQVYARAWELRQQVGEMPQLASALFGLWVFYLVRANYSMARDLAEQLLQLAKQTDQNFSMEAHQAQGITLFYQGELFAARQSLEKAIQRYNPRQEHTLGYSYGGANPIVACLAHLALTLWLLGYPEQAEQKMEESLTLADEIKHPFSEAFALSLAAWFYQYQREGKLAQEKAEITIKKSEEQDYRLLLGFGTILRGWALSEQGNIEDGIQEIELGLKIYRRTGAELGILHFHALLAEAYNKAGHLEKGLALLEKAIETATQKGERLYEPELYRLKGELMLQKSSANGEGETYLRRSLKVAQCQQAKSLELRTAVSLGRFWVEQGKEKKAYRLIYSIYSWFEEGFGTKDLKEAKKLLDEIKTR